MATLLQPAFPFVSVVIDTSALLPVAQRAPGVVADHDSVMAAFANGTTANPLTQSLDLVLQQDPMPSKVYGVRTDNAKNYGDALSALEAADDVTFVCLAAEYNVGAGGGTPTSLQALLAHVEQMSAAGNKRIAVASIDRTVA